MTNHPNRNWRQRMLNSLYQWLSTKKARVLIDTPIARDGEHGMKNRIVEAYKSGYQDGRKSS